MKVLNNFFVLMFLISLCIVVLKSCDTSHSEQQVQDKHYCEMVELYYQSSGERGWPPYKGDCDDD